MWVQNGRNFELQVFRFLFSRTKIWLKHNISNLTFCLYWLKMCLLKKYVFNFEFCPQCQSWHVRAAMPPILWCWSTMSETDGGSTVEVKPSHQYSIKCCCHVTDGSRGSVWQNGAWHGSVYEAMVCHWIPPCGKKWHPLTFIDACWSFWRPNSGCEHSELVGGAFQQRWQWVNLHWCRCFCMLHAGSRSPVVKIHSK